MVFTPELMSEIMRWDSILLTGRRLKRDWKACCCQSSFAQSNVDPSLPRIVPGGITTRNDATSDRTGTIAEPSPGFIFVMADRYSMSWGRLDRVRSVIGYGDTTDGESTTVMGNATDTTTGEETIPTRNGEEASLEALEPTGGTLELLLGDVSDVSPDAEEVAESSTSNGKDAELEALDGAFGTLESMADSEGTTYSSDQFDVPAEETRFEWVDPADLVPVDGE